MYLNSADLSICCKRRAIFSFRKDIGLPDLAIANISSVIVFNDVTV